MRSAVMVAVALGLIGCKAGDGEPCSSTEPCKDGLACLVSLKTGKKACGSCGATKPCVLAGPCKVVGEGCVHDWPKGHQVELTYITSRGPWYRYSWKGDADRSGGIATNIGIHFFDLLMWLFGSAERSQVHLRQDRRASLPNRQEKASMK